MVTNSLPARHRDVPASWQRELADAITDPAKLLDALGLEPEQVDPAGLQGLKAAATGFALRVPRAFVQRMRRGDPADPLLRQVLSRSDELREVSGFTPDPLEESHARLAPNLLRKYDSRALMVTTGACAMHCRYCFRREYDYADHGADAPAEGGRWDADFAALAQAPDVEELILSGGDPLSLSNRRLGELFERARAVPSLRRLRLHTRNAVVLPSRVDAGLLELLSRAGLPVVVVVHVNHPAELDAAAREALRRLRDTGVTLLNQTVLLAGVNDAVDTLCDLSRALFEAGVLPYYLHAPDPVRGTAHFFVSDTRARELLRAVAARLSGFLVPRLVRELPGKPGKTLLSIET